MKTKLLFLVVLIAAVVFSCQKKDSEPAQQDVVFSATLIEPALKNTAEIPDCISGLTPEFAHVVIADVLQGNGAKDYYPLVFYLDGKLYSQAIKLDPGTYYVLSFEVYDGGGDGFGGATDQLYMATPGTDSNFDQYVTQTVPFDFTVTAFTKIEIDVEVLCYQKKFHDNFGFFWFNITEYIIREQCFFGDICLKHWSDYAGSHYDLQPGELGLDMVAIMQIQVYKNNIFVEAFTNDVAPNYGVGAPLCVTYADELGVTDNFIFVLYILVKQGDQFNFVPFHTWEFQDAEMIGAGDDGVVDFVLGSCNLTSTDLQLAPYQNLPATCVLQIGGTWGPGPVSGEYMDAIISGIAGTNWDLINGTYGSYCFDRLTNINVNTNYNMDVFSSLYPQYLPLYLQNEEWDRVNWLINHLDDYAWGWSDLQQVVWKIENSAWTGAAYGGCAAITAVGTQMYNDAVAYGDGYVPLPGGWAAVCFVPTGTPPEQGTPTVQTVFVRVDP